MVTTRLYKALYMREAHHDFSRNMFDNRGLADAVFHMKPSLSHQHQHHFYTL
jgi:hypothetical protein